MHIALQARDKMPILFPAPKNKWSKTSMNNYVFLSYANILCEVVIRNYYTQFLLMRNTQFIFQLNLEKLH
jgi:hypothetical protein